MSKWDEFEAFVNVVNAGGFSAAADKLRVSKSYVSRQVAKLENRLGTQLLHRTTRKITLTEAGNNLHLQCESLLSGLEEAEQEIVAMQERLTGRIRISAVGSFGEDFVVATAIEYKKKYPEVNLEIDFSDRTVDLIAEGYDLAIRSGVLKDSSMIARRIAARNLRICASPKYLAKHSTPKSFEALRQHNCLVGSNSSWRIRDGEHHLDFKVKGSWRTNNGRALLCAALNDLGIVQLPEYYVRDALKTGKLVSLLEQNQPTDPLVWAVYPHNRHLANKVRLFIDMLVEYTETHV